MFHGYVPRQAYRRKLITMKKIKDALKTREFILFFIVSFIIFTLLTNTISLYGLANSEFIIPEGTQIDTPIFLVLFSFVFSLSLKINIDNYRSKKCPMRKKGTLTLSALVGMLASACPICPPFILSIFGVTASALIFPFGGYEIKLLALIISIISLYIAAK